MHLSISSFRSRLLKRHILLLLSICLLLCAALELGTRRALPRLSDIGQRIDSESESALDIRQGAGQPDPVLIVGNSLLGAGVDAGALDASLRPDHRVVRFVLEDTNYLDWYYGMRKLFRDGARPKTVLVMLTARQLGANGIRGDIFGRVLLDPVDVLKVKSDTGLDNTQAGNLLMASASQFYGFRSEIRKWFLVRLVPDFPTLAASLRPEPPPLPPDDVLERRIQPRLDRLARLCRFYGAQLIVILPPDNDDRDGAVAVQRAAESTGVPVLIPFGPKELPSAYYSDHFHLNAKGAAVFTQALATVLRNALPVAPSQTHSLESLSQVPSAGLSR